MRDAQKDTLEWNKTWDETKLGTKQTLGRNKHKKETQKTQFNKRLEQFKKPQNSKDSEKEKPSAHAD